VKRILLLLFLLSIALPASAARHTVIAVPSGTESDAVINTPGQYLGEIELRSARTVTLEELTFAVSTPDLLNNIYLLDEDGVIVAGPVDAVSVDGFSGFQFSDPIQVPRGRSSYTLVGILSASFVNGETFTVCPLPSETNHRYRGRHGWKDDVRVIVLPRRQCGPEITARSASLTVSTDASSPGLSVVAGGSSGVVVGVFNFRATYETIRLDRIGLKLAESAYPGDIGSVTLWDGTTQIGRAFFTGTNRTTSCVVLAGTSAATIRPVIITVDSDKQIIVRADLANIGIADPGRSGDIVKIDYDDEHPESTFGTGLINGIRVHAAGSTDVVGVRMFRSYPTFAIDSLPPTGLADGGLLRFKVTASPAGAVMFARFGFHIEAEGVELHDVNLYGYTDPAYSQPIGGVNVGGQIGTSGIVLENNQRGTAFVYASTRGHPSAVVVPAGATHYFELRCGSVSPLAPTYIAAAALLGEETLSPPSTLTELGDEPGSFNLWSPLTPGLSGYNESDWFNTYGLPGLPSSGLIQVRSN